MEGPADGLGEPLGAGVRSVPLASGDGVGTALGTEPSPPLVAVAGGQDHDEGGGEDCRTSCASWVGLRVRDQDRSIRPPGRIHVAVG